MQYTVPCAEDQKNQTMHRRAIRARRFDSSYCERALPMLGSPIRLPLPPVSLFTDFACIHSPVATASLLA